MPRTWSNGSLVVLASYWFASSFKWFLLLLFLLPDRVAHLVPGGEKSAYWGGVFAVGATWAVIGPALFGHLSDRAGDRRPFILAGALLTCLSLAAVFLAHGLLWLAGAYLLVQVSDDLATGPYSAVVPESVSKEQRGKASGIMSAAMSLSQVVAVLVVLLTPVREAGLYVLTAVLHLSTAYLVTRMIGRRSAIVSQRQSILAGWAAAWRDPDFRWVWLTRFLVTLGFYFVIPYMNYYVRDMIPQPTIAGYDLGSPDSATALLALIIAVTGAAGGLVGGPLIDKIGRKPLSLIGAVIVAVSLSLAAAILPGLGALAAIAPLFGIGYGIYQSATWAMASDVLPDPEGLGRDMGIWQMSISSVQLVAGAAGMIVTFGNRVGPGIGYRILFGMAAVAVLLGGLAVRNVRRSS